MAVRSRIKRLEYVRAGDLQADPRNWRQHPERQRNALTLMLERIGYVDALLVREVPDGLATVDGHLRADLDPDQQVPVLVTDLTEDEAAEVLATFDPLAGMAEADSDALTALLDDLAHIEDDQLQDLLVEIKEDVDPFSDVGHAPYPEIPDEAKVLGEMNFIVSERQRAVINQAVNQAKPDTPDDPENQNSNGNALTRICAEWARQNS